MNIETKERGGIVKGRTVEHRILCCSIPRIKYLLCPGCDSPVNHLSTRQFLTVTFVCARKKRNRSRNFEVFLPAPCRPKAAREGYIAKKKVNTGKNLKRKKRYENSVQTKARKESKHNNQAQKKIAAHALKQLINSPLLSLSFTTMMYLRIHEPDHPAPVVCLHQISNSHYVVQTRENKK